MTVIVEEGVEFIEKYEILNFTFMTIEDNGNIP